MKKNTKRDKKKRLLTALAGIMAGITLLALLLGLFASAAHAASSDEIQEQIDQLKDEKAKVDSQIAELESKLAANNMEIDSMVQRKNGIDQQVLLLQQQVETVNQIISAHNLAIADTQDDLDAAEAQLLTLTESYRARIRAMEEQGGISYWSVIFKANSFTDLLDRLNMIAEIAHSDQRRLEQIRSLTQQIQQTRQELALEKLALEDAKKELKLAQDQMALKRSEADGLLLMLIVKGGEYEFEMDEAEKAEHALMESLAQANKDLEDAKYQEWLATSVPPTTVAPTTNPAGNGNDVGGITWYTPTKNYWISSYYGYRIHPISGKRTFHYGIDMAAPTGTPIYATRSGVVTDAKYQDGGAGYYVWISHGDGYSSVYMHMDKFIVKEGQYVQAGEIIGYVGSTGGSTGPHLHFGITYNRTYVNPLNYINA